MFLKKFTSLPDFGAGAVKYRIRNVTKPSNKKYRAIFNRYSDFLFILKRFLRDLCCAVYQSMNINGMRTCLALNKRRITLAILEIGNTLSLDQRLLEKVWL